MFHSIKNEGAINICIFAPAKNSKKNKKEWIRTQSLD